MSPRRDVPAERRAQIIEAALACFLQRGYTNTTMDDIVSASGLSKGSLYWYFGSKDQLFMSAVTSFFEDFGQETAAALAQCESVIDKVRCEGRALAGLCRKTRGLFSLFLEFWSQSGRRQEAGRHWADMLSQYAHLVAPIIREGVASGEFRPVDAEPLVWAILATYDGLAAYILMKPDLDLDRISEVFIETLLKGLMVDEHQGRGAGQQEQLGPEGAPEMQGSRPGG